MKPRGRPLKPRTDTERLDYLKRILGFGRDRREILIAYDLTKPGLVTIAASSRRGLAVPLGEGKDLDEAIDRAISRKVKP